MVYTAPSGTELRRKRGSLTDKIATELGLIDTELEGIELGDITLASGEMLVGSALGAATAVTPSGDVTITNEGVTAIGAKKVTAAKTAIAQNKIFIGQSDGAAAEYALSGDVTMSDAGVTAIGAKKVGKANLISEAADVAGNIFVSTGTESGIDEVAVSGDATLAANGALTIADSVLEGSNVANVAADNVVGGIPVIFEIAVEDGTANNDITSTHRIKVIDFWFVGGDTPGSVSDKVQLKNGVNAITEEIAKTTDAGCLVRATTFDNTYTTIAAGGTIRVAATKDTNVAGIAYVMAIRVAA